MFAIYTSVVFFAGAFSGFVFSRLILPRIERIERQILNGLLADVTHLEQRLEALEGKRDSRADSTH